MTQRGVDALAIRAFEDAYAQLEAAAPAHPEADIEPLGTCRALERPHRRRRRAGPRRSPTRPSSSSTAGSARAWGCRGPKSVLEVRDGLTFLDVVARQVLALRERHGVQVPLVLMNSFRTREQSLEVLAAYDDLSVDGLPLDFLQNAEPKLRADDLTPVSWPDDPDLEWCPPGHGDVYVALVASGVLDSVAGQGLPLRLPVQLRQPRRHLRPGDPGLDGARVDPLRRPRSASAPSTTARADTWPSAAATAGSCCASSAMVAPEERAVLRGHRAARAVPRQQPVGRPRRPRTSSCEPATASSGCRSSSTARPSTRAARTRPRSSRSSRRWARRSRCSTGPGPCTCRAAGSGR